MTRTARDALVGIGTGCAVFAVYIATLAPGLIDIRDTPAFQYVGRILGVPHQPGYPFYLLISWAFSHVPVGSLAYRMNLLSAVFGAGTVMLTYFVLRRASCRTAVAAGVAAAAGFGPVVWSQSIIAEVYTLETALLMGTVLLLLRWHDRKRDGDFYGAAFLFGLTVAHHPNEVLLLPAVLAFAWTTDRRAMLAARRVAAAAMLVAAAFLPYAYLIVRTHQHAPYVLEPAHTLADVARIVAGAGYRENVFPFSLATLVASRVPMAASLIGGELAWAGCAAAVAGLASLARARHPLGLLIGAGAAGLLAFALNYDVPDIAVFFIPVFWLAWIAAGRGAEAALRAIAGRSASWARAAEIACAAAPLWFVAVHGHDVSLHGRVATMRWADAFFSQIRTPSVILEEDWVIDQVVRYKMLGEGLPPGRVVRGPAAFDPVMVDEWTASNTTVYAFARKAGVLRLMGWPVDRQTVRVSIEAFLESQRPGSIVAVAAPAEHAGALLGRSGDALRALGIGPGTGRALYAAFAGIGVSGASSGGVQAVDRHRATLQMAHGARIGGTSHRAPSGIAVRATDTEAGISVDGRELVRTARGAAVAVWGPAGDLREARVLSGRPDRTIPIGYRPVFAVRGSRRCVALQAGAPADVARFAGSGVVSLHVPADGRLTLRSAGQERADLRLVDATPGARVSASRSNADAGDAVVIEVAAGPDVVSVLASLGVVPSSLAARWEPRAAAGAAATVCAVDTGGLLETVDDRTLALGLANDDQALLLGAGWSKAEPSPGGPRRTTTGRPSTALVPLPEDATWDVRITAAPEPGSAPRPAAVLLSVDGQPLGVKRLEPGWQTVEWPVPASSGRPVRTLAVLADSPVAVGSFTFCRR